MLGKLKSVAPTTKQELRGKEFLCSQPKKNPPCQTLRLRP